MKSIPFKKLLLTGAIILAQVVLKEKVEAAKAVPPVIIQLFFEPNACVQKTKALTNESPQGHTWGLFIFK